MFFMGKSRASQIIKEKEYELEDIGMSKSCISYKNILHLHIASEIDKLKNVYLTVNGWKTIIDNFDESDKFSDFSIFDLRLKAFYLEKLYTMSLKHFDTITNYNDIASLAILQANTLLGYDVHYNNHANFHCIHSTKTLLRWFRIYREANMFPNFFKLRSKKSKLPNFLSENPDCVEAIHEYCKENLSSLSVEKVHDHLHEVVLPNIANTIKKHRNDASYDVQSLKKEYKLRELTVRTVCLWMNILGYVYGSRRKSYYVDNHETPENVKYRNEFISRYFAYELRCHRWVSITKAKKDEMVMEGKLDPGLGYPYSKNGVEYVEYHVDDHADFQIEGNRLPYGGSLSVRFPVGQKPLMIFGQDEAIFKQFIFSKGVWILPDGRKQLVPKDDGQGVMISSFISRELGYNYQLSNYAKDEINKLRDGKHYSDKEAAVKEHGSSLKKPLSSSPFVKEFEYGSNNDGYWSYDQMVLQLEDCIDVLNFTHPEFEILFMFDHSNGHDRLRPDGLNVNKINLKHGGRQPVMRNSKLTAAEFGPYHNSTYTLQPGMEQQMQFGETHEGPCYMPMEERINRRLDHFTGNKKDKLLTKAELSSELNKIGITKITGTKKEIQELCESNNIPITSSADVIVEGWVNKPKGAMQILFERGWIDPEQLPHYTKDGKDEMNRDQNSNAHPEPHSTDITGCSYSIKKLMNLQNDFMQEITLLQYHGDLLGCIVDRSPKCHPEIAGEGIEYCWGLSKLWYRNAPIELKRTKEKFRDLVRQSTDNSTVLHIERVRSCSKKARCYMKLYAALKDLSPDGTVIDMPNKHSIMEGAMKMYSKLTKKGKTHRSVLDRNGSDLREIERAFPVANYTNKEDNENTHIKREMIGKLLDRMYSM